MFAVGIYVCFPCHTVDLAHSVLTNTTAAVTNTSLSGSLLRHDLFTRVCDSLARLAVLVTCTESGEVPDDVPVEDIFTDRFSEDILWEGHDFSRSDRICWFGRSEGREGVHDWFKVVGRLGV